ncbi:protein S100-A1 [Dunckerocampus dactyliophorus]|uniref:protein S100-A1 n=1 Tax=Dunckerocampus dactyliophorus TaxID=161453 RepID=UPI0024052FF2|nr:protein S100-A1 [Dunckerocampus dactyliophorus]
MRPHGPPFITHIVLLSSWLQGNNDAAAIDKIMTDLDENGDHQLDFQEFVVLVAALTVACNDFFEGCCKNKR